jgi:uncharacterized membrane protein
MRPFSTKLQAKFPDAMVALWIGFFVLNFLGFETGLLLRALVLATLALSLTFRGSNSFWENFWEQIDRRVTWRVVAVFLFLQFAGVFLANALTFESFRAYLWDFGQYIQATADYARTGRAEMSLIADETRDYRFIHRTWSLPLLGTLFRWIPHPFLLIGWQSFFLTLPGCIAILGYRSVARETGSPIRPAGALLAFFAYVFSPVTQGQTLWPYVFHIAGISFLALAYLFYFERRWIAWFACLVLLTFEKDEFGLMAGVFGTLVLCEALLGIGKMRSARAALFAIAAILVGVGSYWHFSTQVVKLSFFADRYGHLGSTAGEAAIAFFRHPELYVETLLRPGPLKYLIFFAGTSFLWAFPRWRVLRYFVPIFPFLMLNALSQAPAMYQLKDHYSLPILVGILAVWIFGILRFQSRNEFTARTYGLLALLVFVPPLLRYESPFRLAFLSGRTWLATREERRITEALRTDKNLVLCCESDLCTRFSDRPRVIPVQGCLEGSMHLGSARDQHYVFLVYSQGDADRFASQGRKNSGLPKLSFPERWSAETPFLKISAPEPLPKSATDYSL